MGELLSKLFDIGKLPSKVVFLICAVSAVVLFSPAKVHDKLHTKELVDDYGLFVGLAFISSATLLSLNILLWLYGRGARHVRISRWRRDLAQVIVRLDRAEIAVLREFFIQGKDALMLPVDEPTVAGLIYKGMIYKISHIGRQTIVGMLFPVAIDPDLRDALRLEEHLGLPEGQPSEADIKRVKSERPGFMHEVAEIEAWRRRRTLSV